MSARNRNGRKPKFAEIPLNRIVAGSNIGHQGAQEQPPPARALELQPAGRAGRSKVPHAEPDQGALFEGIVASETGSIREDAPMRRKQEGAEVMKTGQMVRQGDVFVRRIAALPKNAKPVERDGGRIVLAYGEVTGHAHAIHDAWVQELQDEVNARYLEVKEKPATLVHEEHSAIVLAPGAYEVWQQCEMSDDDEPRTVAD